MLYNSTENKNEVVSAAQAIAQGISKDGGLFVPQELPVYTEDTFKSLLPKTYNERAKFVFSEFLTDFTAEEIAECVDSAYKVEKFGSECPAPLVAKKYNGNEINIMELWHGPTCAFKDMALQILPHFLTKSLKKTYDGKTAVILVATSGDTGKAALEGFKDVDHTKMIVFYPVDGVSPMQKRQMTTQKGNNVNVCAIKGNFDDAQTGVKNIFTTEEIIKLLNDNNMLFSSANSINWGRLLPQIVYYISAYCDLVNEGKIKIGDKINIVVPTGNFGNILAAYYAYCMGMPVNKFICASNSNNVLTDFINTGVYDKNRQFYATASPSMDILVSSNLERLLYKFSGNDDKLVAQWMKSLKTVGKYEVTEEVKKEITDKFFGGFCNDDDTKKTIKTLFKQENYLCDTHTSVAINVYNQYVEKTGDKTPVVLASTASPYKFSNAVLEAVAPEAISDNEFEMVEKLNQITGAEIPKPIAELENLEVRFNNVTESKSMPEYVKETLGL
ncbi:MAG: threonine synthase [Oscillospiraceae bacterium]|nr:threonine synthase [Oscillospiraceae bacterium]